MEPAMNTFTPVWVHRSLRADAQQALMRNSLRDGAIHHSFHYQTPKHSQLWLAVHERHAPLFSNPEFSDIFTKISIKTAYSLAGKNIHVIALGPGGGDKEAILLGALRAHGCNIRYTPIDTSLELTLLSSEMAAPLTNTGIHPIAGGLSLLNELPSWLEQFPQEEIRVYTAYGIAPNFRPSELFGALRRILREEDHLLLSANLAPTQAPSLNDSLDRESSYEAGCRAVLPQYDNAETLAWIAQILEDWHISDFLTKPRFAVQKIDSINALVAACEWAQNTQLAWEGENLSFLKGETLRLFFSLRYTPELLALTLAEHGLELGVGHRTSCGQEGVWSVQVAPEITTS
jgi:uncharacterized SAM-dependent methyltransferase